MRPQLGNLPPQPVVIHVAKDTVIDQVIAIDSRKIRPEDFAGIILRDGEVDADDG
jgi:hypothetical protein